MACVPCRVVTAIVLNGLIIVDVVANALLLGRPPETLSQRFARLREYGGPGPARIGRWVCSALTWIGNRFGSTEDHCTMSLDATTHIGTEFWRWSK
ncbi:MAG: hypothetical protein JWP29_3527 [Rhodoferax sp.]|nr:hypothetical protein [Rhodoferax sp.]